jgi:hypothetical protein
MFQNLYEASVIGCGKHHLYTKFIQVMQKNRNPVTAMNTLNLVTLSCIIHKSS